MVPQTPHVMGTPQTPSLTLSVCLAPASSGQPVLMAVLIISSLLPQLAILQLPLEGTVECVSVQHDLHLEQSPTMNSTVAVSEVALYVHTHNTYSDTLIRNQKQKISLKNKKDLGIACHTAPLKKAKKQGEMPLPSLGPIQKCRIYGWDGAEAG